MKLKGLLHYVEGLSSTNGALLHRLELEWKQIKMDWLYTIGKTVLFIQNICDSVRDFSLAVDESMKNEGWMEHKYFGLDASVSRLFALFTSNNFQTQLSDNKQH